ncbi:MAG: bifunctional phosphoribosylaminoimidazolecarboxamide formyltransferase/IMP cyclohydrolase [Myxococcales bacterium]|nr:bifunctional phosphoribosylaminoimidazolecarboxamide formyltransferase/IMP cyclohydrolase [Myxococcales bacterium]MDH3483887.1 bifunctional phosphoribosylaminoimidazolecarboxamide formyltransferase/IMP cyclohydrolase [Myxococcales bacterium]
MTEIKRALISVSDKTGIVEFAKGLADAGVEILSTGGTARALREGGVPVVDVSEYTESPEIMDGRVKTLHPRVHGGILMRDTEHDRSALGGIGGKPIDLVCVNLYPFEQTVARGASHEETIENIDIGGPSMVRSAAKNQARVVVVTEPGDYDEVLRAVRSGDGPSAALRARLAAKAFAQTAAYDGAIAAYLTSQDTDSKFPGALTLSFTKAYDVRYGENPHQQGAFYVERNAAAGSLALAESLGAGGKELSFNNLVDVDATIEAVREFDQPAAVVVKHTNPCGVARATTLEQAYRIAREADAQSAFGGIVALNREVDQDTANAIAETFIECVIAPGFAPGALERLRKKKNLRILATGEWLSADYASLQFKRVGGGLVVQDRDASGPSEVRAGKVVTRRAPTDEEFQSLDFAWRVCKHVKSNAIVFAKPDRTVGVGAGQMARVTAVGIASQKAGDLARGAVMASDAFFPFPDGIEAAAKSGITAVVQPGGSKGDDAVIAAADAAGLAMVFTGVRHFRH